MTKSILQQQQLIELIRESRVEDAIRFSSEQLAERGEEDPAVLEELERTLALLAFEDPHQSPFSDLLSHSHRQKVRNRNIIPIKEVLKLTPPKNISDANEIKMFGFRLQVN